MSNASLNLMYGLNPACKVKAIRQNKAASLLKLSQVSYILFQ